MIQYNYMHNKTKITRTVTYFLMCRDLFFLPFSLFLQELKDNWRQVYQPSWKT